MTLEDILLLGILSCSIFQSIVMVYLYVHLLKMPSHEAFLLEQFRQIRERMEEQRTIIVP